jgi:hypothetical protein
LAAALALAVAPHSRAGRLVVALATGVALHEGVWRGSILFGGVALVAAILFLRSIDSPLDVFDRAAVGAGVLAALLMLVLPGLDGRMRLGAALAGLVAGVATPAGWRLGTIARPRWLAVPFAFIAACSVWLGWSWEYGPGKSAVEQARRSAALGISSLAIRDARTVAKEPTVSAETRLEALRDVFVHGGGRAAWIERVSELRRLNRPEAGPETHRLILLETWIFGDPPASDPSEATLDPRDDFAGRLFLVAGRYAEAGALFRRWASNGGNGTARLLEARAGILDGRAGDARAVLETLSIADPGVACARVDAGDRNSEVAARCAASQPSHRAALEVLGDSGRLATLTAADPVDEEFGGALRLVGRRITPRSGAFEVNLIFEGLAPLLDPAAVALEVEGPATVVRNEVAIAPNPGDRLPVAFEVHVSAPGSYAVKLRVRTPWGPWMRTKRGRVATDWAFPVGNGVVP